MTLLVVFLIFLSAISEAIMDKLSHSFHESIFKDLNDDWWDPTFSWRNKYKHRSPYLGPAFFGSTTFLVFLTDAWHLFKSLKSLFMWTAVGCMVYFYKDLQPLGVIAIVLTSIAWRGVIFELFYSKILKSL